MSSSSSYSNFNSNLQKAEAWYYDVFLSFRGEDTRSSFTTHLYNALNTEGIKTFYDSDDLVRGKVIPTELMQAIRGSRSSVVVLSENYAFSSWCLIELTKIVECMDTLGLIVLPIFYHVNPSHIRNLGGSYGKAFMEHEGNSKLEAKKVKTWKDALNKVGNLAGWHLDGTQIEVDFIKEFIAEVSSRLNIVPKRSHVIEPARQSSSGNVVDDIDRISLENKTLKVGSSLQPSEGNLSNKDSFDFIETCVYTVQIFEKYVSKNIWNRSLLKSLETHFQDPCAGPTKSCSIIGYGGKFPLVLIVPGQLSKKPLTSVKVNCGNRNLMGFAVSLSFSAKSFNASLSQIIYCDMTFNNIKLGSYFLECCNDIRNNTFNVWLLYLPLCCVLPQQMLQSSRRDFEISFRVEPSEGFLYGERGVRLVFNRNDSTVVCQEIPCTAGYRESSNFLYEHKPDHGASSKPDQKLSKSFIFEAEVRN